MNACIITPISPKDEETRAALGFKGPQNYSETDRLGFGEAGHPNNGVVGEFRNHMPAHEIRAQVGDDLFSRYTTISITRNPLDFLISQYFFRISIAKGEPPAFRDWYFANHENLRENSLIAPKDGQDACDVLLQYENLREDVGNLACLPSDFWDVFSGITAKSNFRAKDSLDAHGYFVQHGLADEIPKLFEQ